MKRLISFITRGDRRRKRALENRVVFATLLGWDHVGPHHALPSRKLGVYETRGPYIGEAMMSPDGRRLCILHPDGRAEFTS